MNKTTLLLLGGGIALYYFLTQKKAIGLLNYSIKSVDGITFSGITPILKLTILIQNPSNTSFNINDFSGSLILNGKNAGTVSNFTPTVIPGASQIDYPIEIALSLTSATSDLINMIQFGQGNPLAIEFKGVINAGPVAVPLDLTYTIKFS